MRYIELPGQLLGAGAVDVKHGCHAGAGHGSQRLQMALSEKAATGYGKSNVLQALNSRLVYNESNK